MVANILITAGAVLIAAGIIGLVRRRRASRRKRAKQPEES